jgi:hypothetical protein
MNTTQYTRKPAVKKKSNKQTHLCNCGNCEITKQVKDQEKINSIPQKVMAELEKEFSLFANGIEDEITIKQPAFSFNTFLEYELDGDDLYTNSSHEDYIIDAYVEKARDYIDLLSTRKTKIHKRFCLFTKKIELTAKKYKIDYDELWNMIEDSYHS